MQTILLWLNYALGKGWFFKAQSIIFYWQRSMGFMGPERRNQSVV